MKRTILLILAGLAVCAGQAVAGEQKRHGGAVTAKKPTHQLGGGKTGAWYEGMKSESIGVIAIDRIARLANVPRKTQLYAIDPQVMVAGYFYHFYVRGKYGDYRVESVLELVKLCQELESLETLRHFDPGGEFFSGLGRGVASIGLGVANLATKPGQTLRNFGTRFGRFFRGTPQAGKTADNVDRSRLGSGPAGANRRRLAYKVGIDVYTDNPDVQRVLTGLSHARYSGEIATWAVPAGSIGLFGKTHRDETTEQYIRDYAPGDLRIEAGKALQPILHMKHSDTATPLGAFLHNPNYTPRQIAYITSSLVAMSGAEGMRAVMSKLAHARTPEEADMLYMEVRCHHQLHRAGMAVKAFVPLGEAFGSLGRNGVFTYIFAGDYLGRHSIDMQDFDIYLGAAQNAGASGTEVMALGDVDPAVMDEAERRGIRIVPNAFINVSDKL